VLGLITTSHRSSKRKDVLLRRIDEAARYVPIEDLALSPHVRLRLDADRQSADVGRSKAKLELVVETARKVWG